MDIVNSRRIEHREKVQNKLIEYIDNMNSLYGNILVSPISITLGDEWQLITSKPFECYNLIHEFQRLLWKENIDFYAGIGIGGLNTPVYNDIRKMDGPCFHMSRDAINIAKKHIRTENSYISSKRNKVFFKSYKPVELKADSFYEGNVAGGKRMAAADEAAITADAGDGLLPGMAGPFVLDDLINTVIENNEILKSRMTLKQKILYNDYIKAGSYRKIVAMNGHSGETIGGISQKMNSAEFFTIQKNHRIVSMLLRYYCAIREVRN
jgi:hypothetical protein